jgi:selenide,water dikinase
LAQVLPPIASIFEARDYPSLLVGLAQPDDAAVYQLSESQAITSTVDFLRQLLTTPMPMAQLRQRTRSAMSTRWAGNPALLSTVLAYPEGLIDAITLREILRGGAEKVKESGAVLAGGHTVTDKEPKYGLAVTGIIHPQSILAKGGALVGDALVLTKPLKIRVITTALKRDLASHDHVARATRKYDAVERACLALGGSLQGARHDRYYGLWFGGARSRDGTLRRGSVQL